MTIAPEAVLVSAAVGVLSISVSVAATSISTAIYRAIEAVRLEWRYASDKTDKLFATALSLAVDKARREVAAEFGARVTELEQVVYNRAAGNRQ